MKKYIFASFIALSAMFSFTACSEDEGTEPGNDKSPAVTIYQYDAALPYNSDNDASFRIVGNNKVDAAFYIVETAEEYDAHVQELGEDGYKKFVIENGTEVELDEDTRSADAMVTGLIGEHIITVVAKSGSTLVSKKFTFNGINWVDLIDGAYYFQNANTAYLLGAEATYAILQVDEADETSFRLKDVYGEGFSMKFKMIEQTGEDEDGYPYWFLRVPDHYTGINFGSYGDFYVRDIGYWQGDDAYVTDYGYESGMYEDLTCFFQVQLHTAGGTSFGMSTDWFVPFSDEGEEGDEDEEGGEDEGPDGIRALLRYHHHTTPLMKLPVGIAIRK